MKHLFLFFLLLCGLPSIAQSIQKGGVTEIMFAGRISDWTELTVDSLPYTKGAGAPFSVFIIPKSTSNTTEVEVIRFRGYQGNSVKNVPVSVNQWNVTMGVYFPVQTINTTLFTNYRVFLGFGQNIN